MHQTPVHLAADGGQLECLRLLLEHGGHHDRKDSEKKTPLDYAQRKGHSLCESLLTKHSGEKLYTMYLSNSSKAFANVKFCD